MERFSSLNIKSNGVACKTNVVDEKKKLSRKPGALYGHTLELCRDNDISYFMSHLIFRTFFFRFYIEFLTGF